MTLPRTIAAALLLAMPAWAEGFDLSSSPTGYIITDEGRDKIDMTREGEAVYHLTYLNSYAKRSTPGEYSATMGDVTVHFRVDVGDAETVTVSPQAPWISVPPEMDILDGETGTFLITLPMF